MTYLTPPWLLLYVILGTTLWILWKEFKNPKVRDFENGCMICGRDHETGDCAW